MSCLSIRGIARGLAPLHLTTGKRCMSALSHSEAIKRVDGHLRKTIAVMNEKSIQRKEKACCLDKTWAGSAAEFPWLPGYMVKLDPETRIAGGEVLQTAIQKDNLSLLRLPVQILYPIPVSHHAYTKLRSLCLSEKVKGMQNKPLSLEQMRQLITLVKVTKISDLKWENLIHCDDGTVAIVDTETFSPPLYGLSFLYERNKLEETAKELVCSEIRKIRGYI